MQAQVSGSGSWQALRFRCALLLIWLASKVAGVGVRFDIHRQDG